MSLARAVCRQLSVMRCSWTPNQCQYETVMTWEDMFSKSYAVSIVHVVNKEFVCSICLQTSSQFSRKWFGWTEPGTILFITPADSSNKQFDAFNSTWHTLLPAMLLLFLQYCISANITFAIKCSRRLYSRPTLKNTNEFEDNGRKQNSTKFPISNRNNSDNVPKRNIWIAN